MQVQKIKNDADEKRKELNKVYQAIEDIKKAEKKFK